MKKSYDTSYIEAMFAVDHLRHTQKVLATVLSGLAILEQQGVLDLVDLYVEDYVIKLGVILLEQGFSPSKAERQACMNELVQKYNIRQAGPNKFEN